MEQKQGFVSRLIVAPVKIKALQARYAFSLKEPLAVQIFTYYIDSAKRQENERHFRRAYKSIEKAKKYAFEGFEKNRLQYTERRLHALQSKEHARKAQHYFEMAEKHLKRETKDLESKEFYKTVAWCFFWFARREFLLAGREKRIECMIDSSNSYRGASAEEYRKALHYYDKALEMCGYLNNTRRDVEIKALVGEIKSVIAEITRSISRSSPLNY